MWGQFTPGSKASPEVTPEGKKLYRGITDCWKTGTHTTKVQDIDTGDRATLPVPGAVLEPPVPEASGSEECKMATEVSNVHAGRGRTDNRPAYSWLGAVAGKRFPRSMRRASKAGAGTTQQAAFSAPTGNLASPWQLTAPARQIRPSHLIRLTALSAF